VLFQTSQAVPRCIVGAIQRIGVRPWIEHVGRDEARQMLEQRPVRLRNQIARPSC
jgi:hypothetical protein